MSVTFDEVVAAGNVIPLSEILDKVNSTEPVRDVPILGAKFEHGPAWELDMAAAEDTDLIDAWISFGESERYQFTKEALFGATSAVGLPTAYVRKSPGPLIFPQLNYWYTRPDYEASHKLLVVGESAARAVSKTTITAFSNARLLEAVEGEIRKTWGSDEIYADARSYHSLNSTYIQLVIPSATTEITGTSEEEDQWSVGIQLKNSLTGKNATQVDGYLFRWVCANGALDVRHSLGGWNRKIASEPAEVFSWAAKAAEAVLKAAPSALAGVQHLTTISTAGETSQILRDLFARHSIPARSQDSIVSAALDSDATMYEVMQAITQAAHSLAKPDAREKLMIVGGDLATSQTHRCDSCHRVVD